MDRSTNKHIYINHRFLTRHKLERVPTVGYVCMIRQRLRERLSIIIWVQGKDISRETSYILPIAHELPAY